MMTKATEPLENCNDVQSNFKTYWDKILWITSTLIMAETWQVTRCLSPDVSHPGLSQQIPGCTRLNVCIPPTSGETFSMNFAVQNKHPGADTI